MVRFAAKSDYVVGTNDCGGNLVKFNRRAEMVYVGPLGEGDMVPRWGLCWVVRREYDYCRLKTEYRWFTCGIIVGLGKLAFRIAFRIEL